MPVSRAVTPTDARAIVALDERLRRLIRQVRALGWPAAAAAAYVVVHAVWLLAHWGPASAQRIIADAFLVPPFLAPTIGAWLVAARPETVPAARRAWRLLAFSYFLLFVANVVWFIGDFVYFKETLQIGRWLVVACYPPLLLGLFLFPAAPRRGSIRLRLALDVGTVVLASALVVWYVLFRPRAASGHGVPGLGLVPPVADVGVVLAIAIMLLRRPDPASRSSLQMLASGHLVAIAAGLAAGVRALMGVKGGAAWPDSIWMISDLLIFLATRFPSGTRESPAADELDAEHVSAFPYAFVAVGGALLLFVTREHWDSPEGVIIFGIVGILALVVARQILALRDNRALIEERRVQELRFRSLVQHASDVVTLVDDRGIIEYMAPAAERVFGVPTAAWVGRPFAALARPQDGQAVNELLARAWTAAGEPVRGSWRAGATDGPDVALETVVAVTMDGPDAGKLVLTSRDVTDRLHLEERLRHAQKLEAVGRLAGGVAHDFNNLLAAIRCHAALIREDTPSGDPRGEEAREIELAIDRAVGLTRQLLAFSRKQVLRPTRLDLNEVVGTTERLVRRLVGERVLVRQTLEEEPWSVLADAGQLEQVVMNLAVNARDAMPRGGTLAIETANVRVSPALAAAEPALHAGEYATLTVRDNGVGMVPEIVTHLFEPFFTTKEKGKGTGLGLSTVFGIVTNAGGHVAVASEPGTGSAFTVYLPRCAEAERQTAPDGVAGGALVRGAGDGPTRTILVVDDEGSIRTAVGRILQRAGYEVLTAEDGEHAMRLVGDLGAVAGRPVDLLLTDMVMPKMDGTQLVAEFTRLYPAVPIIRMSGYAETDGTRASLSDVATAFVAKPFTVETIMTAVRDALSERSATAGV